MCGFNLVFQKKKKEFSDVKIKKINDLIKHRGPNDAGYLLINKDEEQFLFTENRFQHLHNGMPSIDDKSHSNFINTNFFPIIATHRRLSIIDLSDRGFQPMINSNYGVTVLFNGEITNFMELKKELENLGYFFKSKTDTEVIIFSYIQWGKAFIKKLNGMFSFVIIDKKKQKFIISRDRYGIKPLYFYNDNNFFLVSSEIKPLLEIVKIRQINLLALNEYLSFQNNFSNSTFFKNIYSFEPANIYSFNLKDKFLQKESYWDINIKDDNLNFNKTKNKNYLKKLLVKSVKRNLIADVKVGTHLSSGIDSSLITKIASTINNKIQTFSAGFNIKNVSKEDKTLNELNEIKRNLSLFNTDHNQIIIDYFDIEKNIDKVVSILETPLMGQSYPNFILSKFISKKVSVCLSGIGADEFFFGYPWRYRYFNKDFIKNYYEVWQRIFKDTEKDKLLRKEIKSKILKESNTDSINKHTFMEFSKKIDPIHLNTKNKQIRNCARFETKTFLKGILSVEDKLSMSQSLEVRFPYLDNDLIDYSERIPLEQNLEISKEVVLQNENDLFKKELFSTKRKGKLLLRKILESETNKKISTQKKKGFSGPDKSWFLNQSKEFIYDRLKSKNSKLFNYLDYDYTQNRLNEHFEKKSNKRLMIWSLLSIDSWLKNFKI